MSHFVTHRNMKHLVIIIIFCALLSASAVDLSPRKIISLTIRELRASNRRFNDSMFGCMEQTLEVVGEEIDEVEMVKEMKRLEEEDNHPIILYMQIEEVTKIAGFICQFDVDIEFIREFEESLINIKKNLTIDKNLNCYKIELEKLQSDSNEENNFIEKPDCNLQLSHTVSPENVARKYQRLHLTKCSPQEFFEPDNPDKIHVIEIKTILMLKDRKKKFNEIVKFAVDERKKLIGGRLKCLLDEIYER